MPIQVQLNRLKFLLLGMYVLWFWGQVIFGKVQALFIKWLDVKKDMASAIAIGIATYLTMLLLRDGRKWLDSSYSQNAD
jgi:hypothetical protein